MIRGKRHFRQLRGHCFRKPDFAGAAPSDRHKTCCRMTSAAGFAALASMSCSILFAQQPEHAQSLPRAGSPYLCNFAKVTVAAKRGKLTVHLRPLSKSPAVGLLTSKQAVYVCDENRNWYRISFGASRTPCGSEWVKGLDVRRTATCQSGWVRKKWIDVLSG